MKKVVALFTSIDPVKYESEIFGAMDDVEFVVNPARGSDEAVIEAVRDADAVIFAEVPITAKIVDGMEKCGIIQRIGMGYDNVDLVRSKEKGIFVCNAPTYGTVDVAEHALALLMSTTKRIIAMHNRVIDKDWSGDLEPCYRLNGRTIGFAGFGRIARALCKCTNGCGLKPIVYDPFVDEKVLKDYNAEAVSFDELLERSDFITIHMPLNDKTRHMFNAEAFKKMKSSAILINTARGSIVDEEALIEALYNGTIAGAGLDVFEVEGPEMNPKLAKAPNVVLTPHLASNTWEANDALDKEVTDNVVRYILGERPENIVNGL